MENIDFKKSVDIVMKIYKKMWTLDWMTEQEIQKIREKEERRQRKIHERFLQHQKQNKK